MEKYLYRFFIALFAVCTFTACGSSDDDPEEDWEWEWNSDWEEKYGWGISTGEVEIQYGTVSTKTGYACYAGWTTGHIEYHSGGQFDVASGASFATNLRNLKDVTLDNVKELDNFCEWNIKTNSDIVKGAELEIYSNFWHDHLERYTDFETDGKVIVKSIDGTDVTLKFENYKFSRMTKFSVGNSTFQDLTVNGEITFPLGGED